MASIQRVNDFNDFISKVNSLLQLFDPTIEPANQYNFNFKLYDKKVSIYYIQNVVEINTEVVRYTFMLIREMAAYNTHTHMQVMHKLTIHYGDALNYTKLFVEFCHYTKCDDSAYDFLNTYGLLIDVNSRLSAPSLGESVVNFLAIYATSFQKTIYSLVFSFNCTTTDAEMASFSILGTNYPGLLYLLTLIEERDGIKISDIYDKMNGVILTDTNQSNYLSDIKSHDSIQLADLKQKYAELQQQNIKLLETINDNEPRRKIPKQQHIF
jgi:hypothetical protein